MSQEHDTKIRKIPLQKLDPDNYRFWVSAASATLDLYNCLELVCGTEPDPTSEDGHAINATVRRSIADWSQRHKLAREALLNALHPTEIAKAYDLTGDLVVPKVVGHKVTGTADDPVEILED